MKVLVDENIPLMTARALRETGHKVRDIRGTSHEGIPDDELWAIARQEGRLLITTDKGFARRREGIHDGILIVRLSHPNRQRIHQRVMEAIARVPASEWPGLVVTMRDKVRSDWRAT